MSTDASRKRSSLNVSISVDKITSAAFDDGYIDVKRAGGMEIRFPVADNPRLCRATPQQLNPIEISPFGLHWPELDEDLSLRGLLEGDYGQHTRQSGPQSEDGLPDDS